MYTVSTIGPDNATKAVEPFMVGIGAMQRDDTLDLFLMQEAAYLASERHVDLSSLVAPGMPSVAEAVADLRAADALGECYVCEPCATVREIREDDLREWIEFGDPADLARLADENQTTMTF